MRSLIFLILACALAGASPLSFAAGETRGEGTVAEAINAGGYVYLKLEESGIWIAANSFEVSKGDEIKYSGGMEMNAFHGKSLDRTFDSIYFVSQASLAGQEGNSNLHQAMPMKKAAPVPVGSVDVSHLKDGQTVETIFANAGTLKGQKVSINARVIKINKAIMGRNWITLQDGTGADPDNRLLATSEAEVSPGDVVVATGLVNTDIDLGYGYTYKVLLEEATFAAGTE